MDDPDATEELQVNGILLRHEHNKSERAEFDDQRHPFRHLRFLLVGRIAVDEFAMDVAGVEIGRRDRHDRGWHQGTDADRREGDPHEPRRKAVQEQRRHGIIVAEPLKAVGEFGEAAHVGGDGEEADQRQQAEHE